MAFLCALSLFLSVCALVGAVVLYVDLRGKRKTIDSMLTRFKQYDRAFTALSGRVSRHDNAFTAQAGRIGSLPTELTTHAIRVGGHASRLDELQGNLHTLTRHLLPIAGMAAAWDVNLSADPNVETEGDRAGINPGDILDDRDTTVDPTPEPMLVWTDLTTEDLARVDGLAAKQGLSREDMIVKLCRSGADAMEGFFRGPRGPANGNGQP